MISIADENDNRPLFTQSSYQAEVTENSPAGGSVLPLLHTSRLVGVL